MRIIELGDSPRVPTDFALPVAHLFTAAPTSPPTVPAGAPPVSQIVPSVSATDPSGGQAVALDPTGKLPVNALALAVVTDDPAFADVGKIWYRQDTSQLCIQHDPETIKRVTLT